jgi:tRNA pseudouridine38-40 synthase
VSAPRRIGLRLEYDGTDFHGWQAQAGHRTVQGVLEATLRSHFDPEAVLDGASRTDAGVHARDQLAAVTLAHPIPPRGLVKALNARLPGDVALTQAWEAALDFQPRFASQGKTYTYRMYRSIAPRPLTGRHSSGEVETSTPTSARGSATMPTVMPAPRSVRKRWRL